MGVKATVETQGNSSDEGQQQWVRCAGQHTHNHASSSTHTDSVLTSTCAQNTFHRRHTKHIFVSVYFEGTLLQIIITLIFSYLHIPFNAFLWVSFLIFLLLSPSCIKFQRSVTFHTSITRETSPQPRCYPEVHCSAQLMVSVQNAVKCINLKMCYFPSDCQILFVTVVQPVCLGKGCRRTVLRWDQNLIWSCFSLNTNINSQTKQTWVQMTEGRGVRQVGLHRIKGGGCQ